MMSKLVWLCVDAARNMTSVICGRLQISFMIPAARASDVRATIECSPAIGRWSDLSAKTVDLPWQDVADMVWCYCFGKSANVAQLQRQVFCLIRWRIQLQLQLDCGSLCVGVCVCACCDKVGLFFFFICIFCANAQEFDSVHVVEMHASI